MAAKKSKKKPAKQGSIEDAKAVWKKHKDWTLAQVAKEAGCSNATAQNAKRELGLVKGRAATKAAKGKPEKSYDGSTATFGAKQIAAAIEAKVDAYRQQLYAEHEAWLGRLQLRDVPKPPTKS